MILLYPIWRVQLYSLFSLLHGVYLGDNMRSEVKRTTIGEWVFSFAVATVVGGLLLLLVAQLW